MKRTLTIIFIFPLFVFSQTQQKDTLKIAFLGDSFCASGNVVVDSSWPMRVVRYYQQQYPTVIYNILCTGGETSYKGLPVGFYWPSGYDYYAKPDSERNVTKALQVLGNASNTTDRICFLEYSGNDSYLGFSADSLKRNLTYLCYVLDSANIPFAISGMAPRQQSNSANLLPAQYYADAGSINYYLNIQRPNEYANIYNNHLRVGGEGRRKVEELSYDSVHLNNLGHTGMFLDMVNNATSDAVYCNCSGKANLFMMQKIGDSLQITANVIGSNIKISGSNNYTSFTQLKSFRYSNGYINTKVNGTAYKWYKVEIFSRNKKTITITKKINL